MSSHSNTWTADNVKSRNTDSPALFTDYSILEYADLIKDTYLITDEVQYRLEAQTLGKAHIKYDP